MSPRNSVMTDVVEINDKESVDDEGEVVRRRTIITLGQKVATPGGSSGSINVTLLNGPEARKDAEQEPPRPAGRASAFNARRTIELRRQQQHLDNNPIQQRQSDPEPEQEPALSKTPSSTYLFGERGSPASSFGGSSLRTMSISMSFDDLESNASDKKTPGRNRSEAWYERRQSYGFEAADKLQSLLNTSGSSDATGAISRSCDSLSSTVRSTSSQIEKMIPPWLKNQSPARPPEDDEQTKSRASFFGGSTEDVPSPEPPAPPPITPTPSVQRSESSRSASNLPEAEPAWLRDLKMRRSLRDNRRQTPVKAETSPAAPDWLNVKLRPTGLNLVDAAEDESKCSPTKPSLTPIFTFINTKQTSGVREHLRNSLENILLDADDAAGEEPEKNNNHVKKSSSVVMVNSSRDGVQGPLSNTLHHHRSVELMRMLDETPLINCDRAESVFTDATSVYSVGEEGSVRTSIEELAGSQPEARKKRVAFGADVKEESDRGRTRPRRIRSRSPETRLRQWQEKLEEVKLSVQPDRPFKHFGDDDGQDERAESCSSETFRSLLQPRGPHVVEPLKESVVIDSYPLMRAASGPADLMRHARNGIVNFDSSVERKIVILETENAPAPKSILKKRSLENLLDTPLAATTIAPAVHSGIKVSITSKNTEPAEQVRPWRIHLKHVDPPLRPSSPERDPGPWRADVVRKRTPPVEEARGSSRGRSPSAASDASSIPGMQAAELIRNLRPAPVMMVARCEVRESAYRRPLEPEPASRADHGYHSLEPDETARRSRCEFRAIDETIAKLNETIEEMRSVNVLADEKPLVIREASEKGEGRFLVREIRASRSATRVHPIVDGHMPTITPIRPRAEPARSASLGSHHHRPAGQPLRRHSSGACTPPPAEPVRKPSAAWNRPVSEIETVKSSFFQSTSKVLQSGNALCFYQVD